MRTHLKIISHSTAPACALSQLQATHGTLRTGEPDSQIAKESLHKIELNIFWGIFGSLNGRFHVFFIRFRGLSCSYCSGKISSLGCYIERLRCCCWNESTKQCLLGLFSFFPIIESCSHSQNISILYYKKGQRSRNNFTYQKKKEKKKKTFCAILVSFLSKVAYYLPVKIITCKMLQENMKILFSQPNICHLNSIIFNFKTDVLSH